jgi:HTH-type transcriptional regulator/antitoxin HigA
MSSFRLNRHNRDSYLELVLAFPLASIKSEAHFKTAQKILDNLVSRGQLDEGEELFLDALSDLIATYEDAQHAIPPASDPDMLRHFLEAKTVSQAELSRDTGLPKSSISEVSSARSPFPGK